MKEKVSRFLEGIKKRVLMSIYSMNERNCGQKENIKKQSKKCNGNMQHDHAAYQEKTKRMRNDGGEMYPLW